MEFNEKLQELRKRNGLTQEELADKLFVSRTAISKWESGRGYPNIDSLKAISGFFCVSIDDLLSGDELLNIAEVDQKQTQRHFQDMIFGLLDLCIAMFLFLPFFGQKTAGTVQSVSLLCLTEVAVYLKVAYFVVVIGSIAFGVLTLALQTCNNIFWVKNKCIFSLLFSATGVLIFIISSQVYAAALLFVFTGIKVIMIAKEP